jgi:hypothetical protein
MKSFSTTVLRVREGIHLYSKSLAHVMHSQQTLSCQVPPHKPCQRYRDLSLGSHTIRSTVVLITSTEDGAGSFFLPPAASRSLHITDKDSPYPFWAFEEDYFANNASELANSQ